MKIVWDEPKRLANIEKHGFDFADVIFLDWRDAVIEKSSRGRQVRFKAIARFEDGVAVVVYAMLGTEAISIISFRPASPKERRRLHD